MRVSMDILVFLAAVGLTSLVGYLVGYLDGIGRGR